MATLGKNWSQQLGFTVTTTGGTVYTHGLGFTPTVVILTLSKVAVTGTTPISLGYTLANTQTMQVMASKDGDLALADVTVGRFHSLIK